MRPTAEAIPMRPSRLLHLLAAAAIVACTMLLAQAAEACGCMCPSARHVFTGADRVVVARFTGRESATLHRYTVQEWVKGEGPRRILVVDVPSWKPSEDGPAGLALRRIEAERYRVLECGHASADVARIAGRPLERADGQSPAAMFVSTDFAGPGRRQKAGAWLDRSGRLLAWDTLVTRAFSVCPEGRLAVQLGATP